MSFYSKSVSGFFFFSFPLFSLLPSPIFLYRLAEPLGEPEQKQGRPAVSLPYTFFWVEQKVWTSTGEIPRSASLKKKEMFCAKNEAGGSSDVDGGKAHR